MREWFLLPWYNLCGCEDAVSSSGLIVSKCIYHAIILFSPSLRGYIFYCVIMECDRPAVKCLIPWWNLASCLNDDGRVSLSLSHFPCIVVAQAASFHHANGRCSMMAKECIIESSRRRKSGNWISHRKSMKFVDLPKKERCFWLVLLRGSTRITRSRPRAHRFLT